VQKVSGKRLWHAIEVAEANSDITTAENACALCIYVFVCVMYTHVHIYTGAYEVVEANAHSDLSSADNACARCIHVYRCVICIQIYICIHMCMRLPKQTAAQTCTRTPVHCVCVV